MPSSSKVAIAAMAGNEAGAHWATLQLFQSLNDTGCTISAVAPCYWVDEARDDVDIQDLTNRLRMVSKTADMVARNAAHLADLLKCAPYLD